jgi:hypothetical protein
MQKILLILVGVICAVALLGNTASAALIFTSPQPTTNEENILFDVGDTAGALLITGETNQTHEIVNFTSTENIKSTASGAANIVAVDGSLTNLTIAIASGIPFGDLILNLNVANPDGGQPETGTVDFTTTEVGGIVTNFNNQPISSAGENRFWLISNVGFLSISFVTDVPIFLDALIQPRISDIGGAHPIPEVSSLAAWSICIAFGAFVGYRRSRRRGMTV